MDRFLLSGASSSLLVMLAVATFGAMMMFKMSSFKIAIAAAVLVCMYALLDSYKEGAIAVSVDGKLIATNAVCIDGLAYTATNASLFSEQESLSQMRDNSGIGIPCTKKQDTK